MKNSNTLKFIFACLLFVVSTDLFALPAGGPFPKFDGQVTVSIKHYDPGMLKLGVGQYLIPNSSFVYTDLRQDTNIVNIVGALVGPIGTLVTAKALSDKNGEAVDGKMTRLPDLDQITSRYVTENAGKALPKNFEFSPKVEGKPHVDISPRGMLNTERDGLARYLVYVEVRAYDEAGNLAWWGRYMYGGKKETKPISGAGSWAEDEGKSLQAISEEGLPLIINRVFRDLNGVSDSQSKEIKFKNCMNDAKNPVFLIEDSPDYWFLKYSISSSMGPHTIIYQKSGCTTAE